MKREHRVVGSRVKSLLWLALVIGSLSFSACENLQLAQTYERPCGPNVDTSSANAAIFASPHEVVVPAGQKQQIWAEIDSIGCSAVRFTLSKALGSVDANGLYTAPQTVKTGGDTVQLIAQSWAKMSVVDTVQIYLVKAITDTCDVSAVKYSTVIRPLLDYNCSACHSTDRFALHGGGVNLDSFSYVANYAKSGMLLKSIDYTGSYKMPKNSAKLDTCAIKSIRVWIEKGANND